MIPAHITTLNQLIDHSAGSFADQPAAGFALQPPLDYREFHRLVLLCAARLADRGLRRRERVAILADNSPQWGIACLATVRLGGVVVPILPDFPEADVKHILAESRVKFLFTSQRQMEKLGDLPARGAGTIITLDNSADAGTVLDTISFDAFLATAGDLPQEKQEAAEAEVRAEDLASIIYTSGTSGHSKAVMLSHGNFLSNLRSTLHVFADQTIASWTFLSILPMSHAYEFTTGFLVPLATGSRIVYAGRTPTPTVLERICREERPTTMCMVPMVIEKIYKKRVLPAINRNALLKKAMRLPFLRRRILRAIGRKLLAFFGGGLKFVAIGGARLNPEVEKFLAEAHFPYIVGYGLTEAAPLVSAGPHGAPDIALGSAGRPVRDVEVRIARPDPESGLGEILVRGPNVMQGYLHNPAATREAVDQEGWLATGDLGLLDSRGNLFIRGRTKSVIVLSHGENIHPEPIEEKINAMREVVESLVLEHNDRLEARVYLDYELLDAEGRDQDQTRERIRHILAAIKREMNRQLPVYSQLARVVEQREPFAKTATHKIKRYLYAGETGNS